MKKLTVIAALFCSLFVINATFAQESKNVSPLPQVLKSYYEIKDALVNTDASTAAAKATVFLAAVKAVDMNTLTANDQKVFTPLKAKLILDAEHIAESKEIDHQRDHFADFSNNIYTLVKAVKYSGAPVYQQYCPMKKMYWLSNEAAIKNPYYGKMMLTCGKVTDTIK